MYILISLFVLTNLIIFFFIFKMRKKDKIDSDKMDNVRNVLINRTIKSKLNFKLYKDFFEITNFLFYNLKPKSLNLYLYDYKNKVDAPVIRFIYKLGENKEESSKLDNLPVSVFNITSKIFLEKDVLSTNINELKLYDTDLYHYFFEFNIKQLYFVNLYKPDCNDYKCKVPYGFILLTSANIIKSLDVFKSEGKKLAENLDKILQVYKF